jgi:hypothetical protein
MLQRTIRLQFKKIVSLKSKYKELTMINSNNRESSKNAIGTLISASTCLSLVVVGQVLIGMMIL